MAIVYARDQQLGVAEYISVLSETTLGPHRPLGDEVRLATMLANANLIVTAREDGRCLGLARALTDFSWVCFLSDLAVRESAQGRGIGTGLMQELRRQVGDQVAISLNAAHEAVGYYEQVGPKLGLRGNPSAYYWPRRIGA